MWYQERWTIMKNKLIIIVFVWILSSCGQNSGSNYQILNNNEPEVDISFPEFKIGEEECIKVKLNNTDFTLKEAYWNCNLLGAKVNFSENTLDSCQFNKLFVRNEVVFICFTPSRDGEVKLDHVQLLLLRDNDYYLIDTSFTYTVEKQ